MSPAETSRGNEDETAFEVIRRMWRRNAIMAVVVRGAHGAPRGTDVIGVITKEHVADSVADSIKAYPGNFFVSIIP